MSFALSHFWFFWAILDVSTHPRQHNRQNTSINSPCSFTQLYSSFTSRVNSSQEGKMIRKATSIKINVISHNLLYGILKNRQTTIFNSTASASWLHFSLQQPELFVEHNCNRNQRIRISGKITQSRNCNTLILNYLKFFL